MSKLGDAERAALDELSLKVATKEINTAADQLLCDTRSQALELSYSLKGGGFQADGDDDVKMKSEAGNQ